MDEAYEQALRLVRNVSVQPLVTLCYQYREWKLHCRNTSSKRDKLEKAQWECRGKHQAGKVKARERNKLMS